MGRLGTVLFCLLLTVGAVTAQAVKPSERPLPQWLTGIIAVAGFLFLCFVGLLVQKAWCDDPKKKKSSAEAVRENDLDMMEENGYDTNISMARKKAMMESQTENTYDMSPDMNRRPYRGQTFDNEAFESNEVKMTVM